MTLAFIERLAILLRGKHAERKRSMRPSRYFRVCSNRLLERCAVACHENAIAQSGSAFPNLSQDPLEVAAEDASDVIVGITSPDESFGHVEHPLGVGDFVDVDLRPKGVRTAVARF